MSIKVDRGPTCTRVEALAGWAFGVYPTNTPSAWTRVGPLLRSLSRRHNPLSARPGTRQDLYLDCEVDAVELLRAAVRERDPGVDVLTSLRAASLDLLDAAHPLSGVDERSVFHRWRVLLAQRALHEDSVPVAALAAQLGYATPSSFTAAFTREVGTSPLRYRLAHAAQAGSRTSAAQQRSPGRSALRSR